MSLAAAEAEPASDSPADGPLHISRATSTKPSLSVTSSSSVRSLSPTSEHSPGRSDLTWPQFLQQYAKGLFDHDRAPPQPSTSPPFKGSYLPAPALPPQPESARRRALYKYRHLWQEQGLRGFDYILNLAKVYFKCEHVILTWVLEDEIFTKVEEGEYCGGPRDQSLCSHSILRHDGKGLVIYDTLKDWRFANNPNVLNTPFVRFYASANIITPEGHNLGSFCIMDAKPRKRFSRRDMNGLASFSQMILRDLDAWVLEKELAERDAREQALAEYARAVLAESPISLQEGLDLAARLIARAMGVECVLVFNVKTHDSDDSMCAPVDSALKNAVLASNLPGLVEAKVDMNNEPTADMVRAADKSPQGVDLSFAPENPDECPDFLQHLGIASGMCVTVKIGNPAAAGTETGVLAAFTKDRRRLFRSSDLHFLRTFAVHVSTAAFRMYADEAAVAKIAFVSSISHELRTPLHGLLACSDLLALTELTPSQEAFVSTIESCGQSLLGVINNVLEISKQVGKRDKQNFMETRVDLFELLQQVVDAIATTGNPNVELLINVSLPPEWRFVKTDPNCVRQILVNLLGNALKFTQEGHVELSVAFVQDDEEHGGDSAMPVATADDGLTRTLRFAVTDTGCGISEDFLPHLTKPFAQEDPLKQGTGLGLVLTRYMASRLGGDLKVNTKPGVGSQFWIDLKLSRPPGEAVQPPPTKRIVRVNVDSPKLSQCLVTMLKMHGIAVAYGFDEITNGEMLIVDRESPQLISLLATETESAVQVIYLSRISHHSRTVEFLRRCIQRDDVAVIITTEPVGPSKLIDALHRVANNDGGSPTRGSLAALITRDKTMRSQRSDPDVLASANKAQEQMAAGLAPLMRSVSANVSPPVEKAGSPLAQGAMEPTRQPASAAAAAAQLPPPPPPSRLHCLIAEDNPTNRMILGQFLKKLNISHVAAHDGQEAIDAYTSPTASSRPFDFILMDLMMPVVDGLSATRRIRQLENATGAPRIRIWALTGIDTESNKREAFESGIDAYLTKPVGLKQLRMVLGKIFGTRVAGYVADADA
ncbi:His Kinase A domain containing protein [Geranomyces michiganensis]|nr:His Kinase A domain containing protein [Geranomyces michiganensis]